VGPYTYIWTHYIVLPWEPYRVSHNLYLTLSLHSILNTTFGSLQYHALVTSCQIIYSQTFDSFGQVFDQISFIAFRFRVLDLGSGSGYGLGSMSGSGSESGVQSGFPLSESFSGSSGTSSIWTWGVVA